MGPSVRVRKVFSWVPRGKVPGCEADQRHIPEERNPQLHRCDNVRNTYVSVRSSDEAGFVTRPYLISLLSSSCNRHSSS